ncbi:MAG: hypothetical protein OEY14_18710 [Myxococcales bacterium]|nr:hypothetical protein [Myxococcales bacterium]
MSGIPNEPRGEAAEPAQATLATQPAQAAQAAQTGEPVASPRLWLRRGARGLAFAGLILSLITLRVLVASHSELQEAERLLAAADPDAAIVHYRRAARWYAPGSPYPSRALDRLAQLARQAEEASDEERALAAWRSIRASILSTRSFYIPNGERLREADARIAALMAELPAPPIDAGKSRAQLEAEHLELLSAPVGPSVGWTLLLLLGFFGWVGGGFAFAARAFDAEDRLLRGPALRWGGLILAGFALFALGLLMA